MGELEHWESPLCSCDSYGNDPCGHAQLEKWKFVVHPILKYLS